jgi:hypothetical protein
VKPGIRTTEFWTTIVAEGVAAVAIVHPGFKLPGGTATVTALATLGAAAASGVYALSRAFVKVKAAANPYAPK